MWQMQKKLRKVKVQNGIQQARCAKNSRATGKHVTMRSRQELIKHTSASVGQESFSTTNTGGGCCLFAWAFYSTIGCDHAANITKSADQLGLIKPTHSIWGIICLCAWFCNQFMNSLYFSTKRQRSAEHELNHTAKNLLGAISGISGELWSSMTVLRCLEKTGSYNQLWMCGARRGTLPYWPGNFILLSRKTLGKTDSL